MSPRTLVVMAAGLGTRFGGPKQLEPIGPGGEALLEFTAFDALRAGFTRVVAVVRPELLDASRRALERLAGQVELRFVLQDLRRLPSGFTAPKERVAPWGTVHALMCAEPEVPGSFAAANADDFYGADALAELGRALAAGGPDENAVVAFRLADTLSRHGGVARAVCEVGGGRLTGIEELREVERADGTLRGQGKGGMRRLRGDELVSMNLWGFQPAIFPLLEEGFERWLAARPDATRGELPLPDLVDELVRHGRARVRVLEARDAWFGITHREDRAAAAARLRALVEAGAYPAPLWS